MSCYLNIINSSYITDILIILEYRQTDMQRSLKMLSRIYYRLSKSWLKIKVAFIIKKLKHKEWVPKSIIQSQVHYIYFYMWKKYFGRPH